MREILLTVFGILLAAAAAILVVTNIPDVSETSPIIAETVLQLDENQAQIEFYASDL